MARTMKDSGIPWVGEVPSDWEMLRNKDFMKVTNEKVGERKNDFLLLSLSKQGVIIRDVSEGKGKFPKDFDTYLVVKPGNLVFCLFDVAETPRTVGLVKNIGMLTGAYTNFKIETSLLLPEFAYYYYIAVDDFKRLKPYYTGLRNIVKTSTFLSLKFPCPPLPEQKRIAEYLDKVTESIDGLRAKIEREIERLGDWRKSVITESVCHGLDKNAAMKDSGIPWVGKVPSAWEVNKIKYWFAATNSRGNSILQLLSATQKYGMYPQSKLEGVVQVAEKTDLNSFKTVHIDDFVISLRSFQGGIERSDYEGVCSPAYQTFHATRTIDTAYFKHLFKSQGFIAALNLLTVGIREGKTINYSDVRNMLIPVPPLPEQKRIAEYLDNVTAKVDEMIGKRKAELERLESLKRSIVCECVTGKRVVSR